MKTKAKISAVEKIIDCVSQCLTTESAERLLKLRLDAKLQKEIDSLAEKCTEGTLTPEEREEYGDVVVLDTFIAILKSKARQKLAPDSK